MHTERCLPHRHQNRQRGQHQRNPARLAVRPHPPDWQGHGRHGQPLPHHRMERPPHGRGQTSRRPIRRNRQRAGLAAAAILRPDHPIGQDEARTAGRLPANRRRKHTLRRNRPRRLARHGLHPAQRRSHPPRQRRSGARDIQRRQKPSPRLRSGGNGAGMERRNRAIPHRQQPPMPCSRHGTGRTPNRAFRHGSGRFPPVRRFEGRQIHRRPHCLEHMGQPRRPDADLDGHGARLYQPSQRPQRRPIGTGRNRAGQRPASLPNRLFRHQRRIESPRRERRWQPRIDPLENPAVLNRGKAP